MKSSFHPLAAITASLLLAAFLLNFFTVEWHGQALYYALGSLLLASPFMVLLAGHVSMATTWRRNGFLAVGSLLFAFAWAVASFAMRWFQPGMPGALVLGAVMAILAGAYLLLARLIREPQRFVKEAA